MSDIKQYEPLWGSWYVDSLLGEGSFGKVYKVHKEEFGKTYDAAVKMISIPQSEADLRQAQNDGLDAASARSYFHAFVTDIIQEIDLMSAFRGNSHIVSLEDHKVLEKEGEIGWDILIRMELLTTLSSHVMVKPMTSDDVVTLGVHICRALEVCAARKTIHRDIKPDNIFVSPYGDYKLGDFGIARQIERTMSGLSKKGTYTYMAPEVFKGSEYGASVDLYSLGIVMYRFLNKNRTPFLPAFPNPITPRDREEALQRRMSGEPLPPIQDIDPTLNAIVLKACAYDRDDRFLNATEMRTALESLPNYHHTVVEVPNEAIGENMAAGEYTATRGFTEWTEQTRTQDGLGGERTKGVFSLHKEAPQPEQPVPELNLGPAVPKPLVNALSIFSGLCFSVLAVLSFLSGDRMDIAVFLPLYMLCAAQCFFRFQNLPVNAVFRLSLVLYLLFGILGNFQMFDYSFLILTAELLAFEAAASEKQKAPVKLCAVLILCALLTGLLVARVNAETHYSFVAGAAAIPVALLLASPAALLLRRRSLVGYALLIALQFFPFAAFVAYRLDPGAPALFYIADANFIGFSPERFSWWPYGRFMGILLQLAGFGSLLALAAAKVVPEHFLTAVAQENRRKMFALAAAFVLVLFCGLLTIVRAL